jgi:hypothetical protein
MTDAPCSIPDFRFQVDHDVTILKFDVSPEEVTRRLGLIPTKTFRAGDALSHIRKWQWDGWVLEAPSLDVDTEGMNRDGFSGLDELVAKLHSRLEIVQSLCPPGEISFMTIIATDHTCPSVGLTSQTNRLIVELCATWHATIWPTSFDDSDDDDSDDDA